MVEKKAILKPLKLKAMKKGSVILLVLIMALSLGGRVILKEYQAKRKRENAINLLNGDRINEIMRPIYESNAGILDSTAFWAPATDL